MFHHHILPSLLPPRDSSCLICDIIKHLVIHHHCIHHSVTLLSLSFPFRSTHLHLFSPRNRPTRSYMPWSARWMPSKVSRSLISRFPLPSLTFSHDLSLSTYANTSAAIQDWRIMNCSWRLWGACETKGFLLSCIRLLAPFIPSLMYHFPFYFNAPQIDQQSEQKLAVL